MRSLFVASAGGHLEELRLLAERLDGERRITWVTWETPQSAELLAGEDYVFIPHVQSHSVAGGLRSLVAAWKILAARPVSEVVSTGALPAVPFMALARLRRIRCVYIESAARVSGPSWTGRLVGLLPGVERYSQHERWCGRSRWSYFGSIFDGFAPGETALHRPVRRAVVMAGSSRFGFRRLVASARSALPPDCETVWQTGATDVSGLGVDATPMLSPSELAQAVRDADVVISHAGVGSALLALQEGRCPILVPRRAAYGEHADDHQLEVAADLERRGLAVCCEAAHLDLRLVEESARRSTARASELLSERSRSATRQVDAEAPGNGAGAPHALSAAGARRR